MLSGLNLILQAPMIADPGTTFECGINIDWLERVVEAAGAMPFDEAIRVGLTDPLAMGQRAFLINEGQRANSVAVHVQGDGGGWVATEIELNQGLSIGREDTGCTRRHAIA